MAAGSRCIVGYASTQLNHVHAIHGLPITDNTLNM